MPVLRVFASIRYRKKLDVFRRFRRGGGFAIARAAMAIPGCRFHPA